MKNIFIVILLLIVISGCGMMGNSNSTSSSSSSLAQNSSDTNSTQDMNNSKDGTLLIAKSILPKNISMEFPTILKDDDKSQKKETSDTNSSSSSIGYNQLKEYINQIDDIVKIAEINLVILKKAMPQVLDRCEGMSSCIFEAGYLSIVLDNETITNIDNIIDDKNFTAIDENLNKRVYLGELEFKKEYLIEDDGYRYELKLDLASNDELLDKIYKNGKIQNSKLKENNRVIEYQIFKWFDFIDDVTTLYLYKDENRTIDVRIYYSIDEYGKESMHILKSSNTFTLKNNMNLTLSDQDIDESLKLTANSIEEEVVDKDKKIIKSFSSNGEIREDNSLILFSGNIEDDTNNTTNKPIISEVICDNSECIENNISTENKLSIDDEQYNTRENLKFYQIEIEDTNLSDGSFLILPPYTDIEDLKLIDIFKLSIGTFTILDGKAQGEIHSSQYSEQLDELTIVKIEDNGEEDLLFTVIRKN